MDEVAVIGLDLAKSVFQVHGIDTVLSCVDGSVCARVDVE